MQNTPSLPLKDVKQKTVWEINAPDVDDIAIAMRKDGWTMETPRNAVSAAEKKRKKRIKMIAKASKKRNRK